MWEKFKTACLVFMIFSSMLLTYHLWFGRPSLEEGTVPRYEYVYFTPLPLVSEIVQPAEVVFWSGEEVHLFRRGDEEYQRLWDQAWRVLTQEAEWEKVKRSDSYDLEIVRETAACKLIFPFQPPLPLEYISDWQATGETKILEIIFLWDKDNCTVLLEGEETFGLTNLEKGVTDKLQPVKNNFCFPLPRTLSFSAAGGPDVADTAMESKDSQEAGGLLPGKSSQEYTLTFTDNTGSPLTGNWEISVPHHIFVEKDDLFATEILLEKKKIPRDELIKSFFLDLSLARRIEEKDGAVYFTNGEKGLRIYASGLVEFTAPRPENTFRQHPSYALFLQKGAESQSLYGGILPDTYLCDAREVKGGCRLIWRRIVNGLVLEGENAGCEMLLEGQGVSFLRRNFWLGGTEVGAGQPFCPFEQALERALILQQERLQGGKATLLSLRPVYYLPAGSEERAIPAWEVNFAETEVIYLHCSTLEQL